MNDPAESLEAWRDGRCDGEDAAILAKALLGTDGPRLRDDLRLMEMLAQSHPEGASRCVARVNTALAMRRISVRQRALREVCARLTKRSWWRRTAWLAAVAGLLAGIGLTVQAMRSDNGVTRDGRPLSAGAAIVLAEGATSELRWEDGSEVSLSGPTTARVIDGRLHLDSGGCRAVAVNRRADSFEVETPHGRASANGSRFRLRVADATALIVDEGTVRIAADGADRLYGAGGLAMAGPGTVPGPPVTAADRRPIGMLWMDQGLRVDGEPAVTAELDDASRADDLANRLDHLAGHVISTMAEAGGQGVVVWDALDGDSNQLRPGLARGFDGFMRRLHGAGLGVGVGIQAVGDDGPDLAARLAIAVARSKVRWDVDYALITNYSPDAATALPLLQAAHPDVLLMPVNGSSAWGLPVYWGADRIADADAEDACGVGTALGAEQQEALESLWRAGAVPLIYAHWLDSDHRELLRALARPPR